MAARHSAISLVKFEEAHLTPAMEIERASNSSPWSERSFRNELDNPQGDFRIALEKDLVLGFGGVWDVIDEAHVTTIAVHPEHRRLGIASLLMKDLLERALSRGMNCSTLEVRVSNLAAISMYEKLGYKRCAIRKNYYPDNHEGALVMWLYDLDSWQTQ